MYHGLTKITRRKKSNMFLPFLSQFKNTFTLSSLLHTQNDFGVKTEHHFLATSHGKGPHDGIGGSFKRLVKEKVLSKNLSVTTGKEFFDVAESIAVNTKVLYVSKQEIESQKAFLNGRWKNLKTMKGLRSCHVFSAVGTTKISTAVTSRGDDSRV
jgi:hypothetical protein